jgi:flagellar biosynthetic protein FlhB
LILEYNLQFFAKDGPGGEKTEPATSKKLQDARKDGQVAKSKEIANAFGLLALFLIIRFYVGSVGTSLKEFIYAVYNRIPEVTVFFNGEVPAVTLGAIFVNMMVRIIMILAPIMLIAFLIAFLCDVAQVKWQPTGKPLQTKFSKLNPIKGFSKIFSKSALVELIKALAKIGLIAYVTYTYLVGERDNLFLLYDISIEQAIGLIGQLVTDLGIRISMVYMIIAFADYAYQKVKFSNDMKMTKQEVKDEFKNSEGDPQVKAQQRRRMMQASQRRMMQQLPEADVVITNPTHYAVAIKYDGEKYEAPVVLAKGENYLAFKIKEIAQEHHIEIVENKPLARMLYANVEVGEFVPPELYQAVAEVLAMVYHMQGKV